jgi:hypothetical protein
MVNTKKVVGRRDVRYESYDDLLADAQRLARGPVRQLGNWSPGKAFKHLAQSLDSSIDGAGFALPAPMRVVFTLLMKNKFLNKQLPAGFKTTPEFTPPETSTEEGLELLRSAVARQKQQSQRALHPAFGRISREEWDKFNLRHAELHMSFLLSDESDNS